MQNSPIRLLRFDNAVQHDPAVDQWFEKQSVELSALAQPWFDLMRECGEDVRELLHDGHPTVCIGDAAFGYVNAFTAHVNVGFFLGAWLDDPDDLLEGTGKRMRHVKVKPGETVNEEALAELIRSAYRNMQELLQQDGVD